VIELTLRTSSAPLTDEDVDILLRFAFHCMAMDRADSDLMLALVNATQEDKDAVGPA
jgi:hypothetical protein